MRSIATIALLAVGLVSPGCLAVVAAGAAVGYMQFDKNEAWQEFDGELADVFEAAQDVVVNQGYLVKEVPAEDATQRVLEGEDIKVTVEQFAGDKIKVSVRVGTFDTEDHRRRAELVLEEIEKKL